MGRVIALVAGGDDDGDSCSDGGSDSCIEGIGEGASNRQVDDGLGGQSLCQCIRDSPLDSSNDTGVGACSIGIDDLDGDEGVGLADAEGLSTKGSRDVSAVAVLVRVHLIDNIGSPDCTTTEFLGDVLV